MSGWVPSLALASHLVPAQKLEARERRGRLPTGIPTLDEALGGGWPKGALSEIAGGRGAGRTSLVFASLGGALARGESCAIVDGGGTLDPWAALRAGVALPRLLWVRNPGGKALAAAELVLEAGGFGLLVLDLGEGPPRAPTVAWQRLKRGAERHGTAVLVASVARAQGVGAACAVTLHGRRARFDRGPADDAPALLAEIETALVLERLLGGPREGGAAGPTLALPHPLARASGP